MNNTKEFYYEDFCTDISNYIKENQKDFMLVSWDHLTHHIDKDKLAITLSNFWLSLDE